MKYHYREISRDILDVKLDTRTECFNWGKDNAFPSLLEALISMSVTARNCVLNASKAIYGGAFGLAGNEEVNSKGQSLNEALRLAAREYAKHSNVFIHVTYNASLEIATFTVLPDTDVRVGKSDDKGYSGKFIVYNNWDKRHMKKIMSNRFVAIDRYNSDKAVIKKQIINSAKEEDKKKPIEDILSQYNGQILHIKKDTNDIYALSDLYTVLDNMITEHNSQRFRSKGTTNGFLNNKAIVVQPFETEDDKKDMEKVLDGLQGSENTGNILIAECAEQSDDVSTQFDVKDLSGTHNDKLFQYSDSQAEVEICKSMLVPRILVNNSDSSLFGSSGELIRQAKIQLWESREEDRILIQSKILGLYTKMSGKNSAGLEIINPHVKTIKETE